MKPLLIIGGATGTGKSEIAVACALKMNGEVISADSMQIYKGLDIGTAKITEEEKKGVKHYMIDILSPDRSFTAADYKAQVIPIIDDILSRGKLPILCGGTGLYINAVLYDLSFSGKYDPELREKLQKEALAMGKDYMHQKLRSLDPVAAEKLHVNDEKRVIRAIEKAMTGGKEERDLAKVKYPYKMFLTSLTRESMYDRIEKRVDRMMEQGLKTEVRGLISAGIGFDKQCMQAIAYKEWAQTDLTEQEIVESIKKHTRNYAKRQITWFKQYKKAIPLHVAELSTEELVAFVEKKYNEE